MKTDRIQGISTLIGTWSKTVFFIVGIIALIQYINHSDILIQYKNETKTTSTESKTIVIPGYYNNLEDFKKYLIVHDIDPTHAVAMLSGKYALNKDTLIEYVFIEKNEISHLGVFEKKDHGKDGLGPNDY